MMVVLAPLEKLITEIKKASDFEETLEEKMASHLFTPLIKAVAISTDWLEEKHFQVFDAELGFHDHLIYEGNGYSGMTMRLTTWLPGRGYPPHNHGTWSISASIIGSEEHILWEKNDITTVRPVKKIVCHPGDVLALPHQAIHSVTNNTNQIAISLHLYGQHPDRTQRQHFIKGEK